MRCSRCKAENREGLRFCEDCGARLAATCPSCGAEVTPGKKFCGSCGTPFAPAQPESRYASPQTYTPNHLAEKILSSKTALEGERKQVTVLFADLKGSMELLADRDPEEARKVLDPVLERLMEAVHRYEGTVNQVMGDGIMALFGAPVAHEDHAVRACYAALRMQETVKRYAEGIFRTYGVPVRIRVGLNSGEVVVRSIGSDLHMDYTAVGQTTHLAARMEQLADPGTIRLTADALHLAEGFVQVQALGPTPIKGLAAPVEVYELTGASPVRSRLQATAARGLTRFVGRDAEMATLFGALEHARAGRGQVVAIVGEPGVGKSRLVWEFMRSHRTEGCLVLEAPSVSYGKATTYLPVIDLLKRYAGIEAGDDGRKVREKVTGKLFSLDRALESCLVPLLWLLDAPMDDAEWERLDPVLRRQRLHEAIRRLLLRETREQPLVLVFEDLHWIDGETQAFLDGLVESLPTARMCLLVNYRPEYRHGWGGKTFYTQMRLDTLGAASAAELLAVVLGPDPSVQSLVSLLIARTEGNPFFLEETVQTLAEAGALTGERGAYRLVRTPEALDIPATAQAILSARIDRLVPEDKRLLQTAAVIGKDVPYPLLATIAELDESALRAGLARLQEAEFLYEVQLFPELEHTFKHALTHDVAYAGLLGERRRALHAAVTTTIERLHADRLVEHVERLAHHARQGEVWDKAVWYLRRAGTKVSLRSAHREAAAYFEQALEALRRLPKTPDRTVESLDLRFDLRSALLPLGEFPRMATLLDEGEALAQAAGDQHRLGRVLNYKAIQFTHAGDFSAGIQNGQRALAIGEAQADLGIQVVANWYLGCAHMARGECRESVGRLAAAIALIPADLRQERFGQAGIPAACARCFLGMALGDLGRFAEGLERVREGMDIAEEARHVFSTLLTLFGLGTLKLDQGEFAGAVPPLERGVDLCRTREVPFLLPDLAEALGAAYHRTGRHAEGIALMEDAARDIAGRGTRFSGWAGRVVALGEAYLLERRLAPAARIAHDGLATARHRGERGMEGHLLRLLGDAAAHPERFDADAAEVHYRQALALADELGMRPLIAHCHAGLAKVYRRKGESEQAQQRLTTATTLYREMGMIYWLEQLEAEMTELA